MNEFVSARIRKCLEIIGARRFDEFHVKSLLIDLREYVNANSITREVADFIAHPERDRGMNHKNINRMIIELKDHYIQKGDWLVTTTFLAEDVVTDISKELDILGFRHIDILKFNIVSKEVVICLMGLLQGISFQVGSITGKSLLYPGPDDDIYLGFKYPISDLDPIRWSGGTIMLPFIATKTGMGEYIRPPKNEEDRSDTKYDVIIDKKGRYL